MQNGIDFTTTYAFDLAGNRVGKVHDAVGSAADQTVVSLYNSRGQITSADSTLDAFDSSYTYDANGNTIVETTGSSSKRYVWDLRDRMAGLDANNDGDTVDTGDATFAYDDAGVRVGKSVVGQSPISYLQSTNNPTGYSQVLEERTNGTLTRSYLIGSDVIAQADGSPVKSAPSSR